MTRAIVLSSTVLARENRHQGTRGRSSTDNGPQAKDETTTTDKRTSERGEPSQELSGPFSKGHTRNNGRQEAGNRWPGLLETGARLSCLACAAATVSAGVPPSHLHPQGCPGYPERRESVAPATG